MAFFSPPPLAQDRTGRRKWCLVRAEQICHPISRCSTSHFPLHFSSLSVLSSLLAPSPEPMSASHPRSPILTLAAPSPLTFCTAPPSRDAVSRFSPSPSSFLFFSLIHSFPVSLIFPLAVSLCEGGGVWLSWSEMNFRLLSGQHSALIGQNEPGRRGNGCRKEGKKKRKEK